MTEDRPPPLDRTEERGRLAEVRRARRQVLDDLRRKGVEPFALTFAKDADAADLHARFAELGPGEETGVRVAVAGRVMRVRAQGRLTFLTLRDRSGDIQLFCTAQTMGADGYAGLEDLHSGDIVGAGGEVMRTRRGELSIRVENLTLLTKSLRPLPEKWHGLKDPELRLRLRYLELATSLESRRFVEGRAKVLQAIRRHLDGDGFVEVETPVLHPTAGGALARPFVTHHWALDIDMYLRIAIELYLKRLLVAGIERVYEIGRNFRNEGMDRIHAPEFTMLEVYQAYADYEDMMALVEVLVREASLAVRGTTEVVYQGRPLDLGAPWKRVTVLGSVSEATGLEITLDRTDLSEVAEAHGVGVDPRWTPGHIVVEMFEQLVQPDLWDPTFVCDFPRDVSPLARPHREDPALTEHFDPYIAGIEMGAAYSELTDPEEQRAKFEDQQRARQAGDEEAHPVDEDFLVALEHGMPPAGGLGLGIDRLLMVLTDAPSIREVILFPALRPGD